MWCPPLSFWVLYLTVALYPKGVRRGEEKRREERRRAVVVVVAMADSDSDATDSKGNNENSSVTTGQGERPLVRGKDQFECFFSRRRSQDCFCFFAISKQRLQHMSCHWGIVSRIYVCRCDEGKRQRMHLHGEGLPARGCGTAVLGSMLVSLGFQSSRSCKLIMVLVVLHATDFWHRGSTMWVR